MVLLFIIGLLAAQTGIEDPKPWIIKLLNEQQKTITGVCTFGDALVIRPVISNSFGFAYSCVPIDRIPSASSPMNTLWIDAAKLWCRAAKGIFQVQWGGLGEVKEMRCTEAMR